MSFVLVPAILRLLVGAEPAVIRLLGVALVGLVLIQSGFAIRAHTHDGRVGRVLTSAGWGVATIGPWLALPLAAAAHL
jgi:hypothetical protein